MDQKTILEVGLVEYNIETCQAEIHHIIITEHEHLSNGIYVHDNRDSFNFGWSERMSFNAAMKFIQRKISQPSTCLIGHSVMSDVEFLKQAYVFKFNNLPYADTQNIFKYHSLTMQNYSLTKVLDHLKLSYRNLHNAGNDAYYTLLAFVKMANLSQTVYLIQRL